MQIAFSDVSTSDVLDPAKSINQFMALLGGLIFDPLMNQDSNFNPTPGLATDWEVSPDSKTWTFNLRDDVTFHDGTPMTSKDVAYTIARQLDKELGSRLYGRLSKSLSVEGISTPTPTQVVLSLTSPDALLATALASRHMYVLQAGTKTFDGPVVGTGPFELVNWNAGTGFEVTRNDNYWRPELPYLDGVRGVVIADQASKLRSVVSGPSDVIDSVDFSLAATAEQDPSVKLWRLPSSFFVNFAMDQTVPPFDDVRVRQAMKLALDREKFVNAVYGGYATVSGDVPVLPSDINYPSNTLADRNVDEAKRLLAEAGYPGGIDVELFTAPLRSGMVDAAVVLADSVKDAGIRVKVTQQPAANYFTSIWLKKPFYVSYWATRQAAEEANLTLVSDATSNESKFNDPEFDRLIADARTNPDSAQRIASTSAALELAALNSGWMIPAIGDFVSVSKANVEGLALNSLQVMDFSGAWIAAK
ncbi:MAG: ABC transporter substrate-binding protein [Microbacteriaceae bacterium]